MRRAGLLAAAVLSLSGCGLDVWPYLDPPGYSTEATPSDPRFSIINQATLVPEFRGFEVYYKFFSSDQSAEQSSQSGLGTREALVAAGFKRMCAPGSLATQVLPFVPVDPADRNTDFKIVLDFNPVLVAPDNEPVMDYQGAVPPANDQIHRSATYAGDDTKTFALNDLDQADSDMTTVAPWPVSGQTLNLVAYALSYGLKDYTDHLYSSARYLGYMSYTFP